MDTNDLLAFGVTPAKKSHTDVIEAKKHHDLFMRLAAMEKMPNLAEKDVLQWHGDLFDQTMIGEAGGIRTYRVGVVTNERIEFAPIVEIPKQLAEFFDWLCRCDTCKKNAVEIACMAHYRFVSIHPFGDGNGRISRLIMNYILIKHGYPPLVIRNTDRRSYFGSLEKSHLNHDEIHFLRWFMGYYIRENRRYL